MSNKTFAVPCTSRGRRYSATGGVLPPGDGSAVACNSPVAVPFTSRGRRYSSACGIQPQREEYCDLRSSLREQGMKTPCHGLCPFTTWQGRVCLRAARSRFMFSQGRRTQILIRALFSNQLRLCISRWGSNNHSPRAFMLPLRLASQQRTVKFLIVQISALQKAREKGRINHAVPKMTCTTSKQFASTNCEDPHPVKGGGAAAAIFATIMPACPRRASGFGAPLIKLCVRDGAARRPTPWIAAKPSYRKLYLPRFARNLAINLCLSATRGAASLSIGNLTR
jgi:hypothetical protein